MDSAKKDPRRESPGPTVRGRILGFAVLAWLGLFLLLLGFPGTAQAQSEEPAAGSAQPVAPDAAASAPAQQPEQKTGRQPDPQLSGSVSGTVLDQLGAVVAGAVVTLTRENQTRSERVVGDDGQFSFADVAPGPFELFITATGLATETLSGVLQPGENYLAPQITLRVATAVTVIRVEPSRVEIAEEQIKEQEKQRVLTVIPNFYVSYLPDAVPLTSKQKFELAWRTVIDPFTLGLNAVLAGAEQANNQFAGFGQGAQGYGKRFGAGYADIVSGTFIGGAILPSILKQDPRYFYKGTGSKRSRLLYALANSIMCKGDDRHWQPNYSGIAGSLAAGGLSNLYYPKNDRYRVGLVFENTGIGIGETAVLDVLQEFFIRKLTPKPASHSANQPANDPASQPANQPSNQKDPSKI